MWTCVDLWACGGMDVCGPVDGFKCGHDGWMLIAPV